MVSLLAVTEVQQPSMVGNFPTPSSWSSDQARRYLEETAEMTMSATFISLLNIDSQPAYLFSLQLVDGNELLAVISVSIPPTIGIGETIKEALEDYANVDYHLRGARVAPLFCYFKTLTNN